MIHYIEGNQLNNEVMSCNKLMIVEFYIPNSKPCEMQSNVLHEIEQKYRNEIEVFKIDIEKSQEWRIRYHLSSFPTIIFFKNGAEIERRIGYIENIELEKFMQEFI